MSGRRRRNNSGTGDTLKIVPFLYRLTISFFMPASVVLWHALVKKSIQVKPLLTKNGDNYLILRFWWHFLHPYLPLHTKQTQYQ